MTIHEFGQENDKTIVLIHPSIVMWDYFAYVIPLLEKEYHLIIPALPGYDPDARDDFTSVTCLYGCSMGGSIATRMLADNGINIQNAVIDGGITPYQLPWIVTRLIAVKDFLMISAGKIEGNKGPQGGCEIHKKGFSTYDLQKDIGCRPWRTGSV